MIMLKMEIHEMQTNVNFNMDICCGSPGIITIPRD